MRPSSLISLAFVSVSALAAVACAPDENAFGNASGPGGGGASGEGGDGSTTSAEGAGAPQGPGPGTGAGGPGGGDPTSGPGGGGSDPACDTPDDCDDPAGECVIAACAGGVCGTAFVPQGTPTVEQSIGDCRETVCDGAGQSEDVVDDGDLVDDDNECTIEACVDGELVVDVADPGTSCGNGLSCNGAGECTGCSNANQCPGDDDDCQTRTCDGGTCGLDFEDPGTVVEDAPGDCVYLACDGEGHAETVVDDGDVPDDGLDCTRDVCNDGEPANPPRDPGADCDGGVCDGEGACVGCVEDGDCGTDTECALFECNDGTCDVLYADPGDPAGDPVPDDCLHDECDGQGGIDEDVPEDAGESCGGGNVCDGAGNCAECGTDDDCDSDTCRCGTCHDYAELFFSQYVEGSGNTKALEIYNPRRTAVDLADFECAIYLFRDGDGDPDILDLTGEVAPGDTYVVCHTLAPVGLGCDQRATTAMDFNGDDALALVCDLGYFDAIGEIGVDPGAQWGSGLASTADNTLTRKPGIVHGRSPFDAFEPSDEFIGSDNNDTTGLGAHDICE